MEYLKTIITSVLASFISVGIFTLFAKQVIIKAIELGYQKKVKKYECEISVASKIDSIIKAKSIRVFPEILEVTYRLKDSITISIKEDLAYKWNSDIRTMFLLFSEYLFEYKVYFSNEIFIELHRYKELINEILVIQQKLTVDELQFNKEVYYKNLPEIKNKVNEIEMCFNKLALMISDEINKMRSIDG